MVDTTTPTLPPAPSPAPVAGDQNTDPQIPVSSPVPEPANPVGRRQKEAGSVPLSQMIESLTNSGESNTDSVEQASSGPVEVEPAKELEPEVEKMVERIQNKKVKGPDETVISAQQTPDTVPKTVAQPIVVLPLTEEGMKRGKAKNTEFSVRWLYEWCARQIRKMRDFLVVYREE